MYDTPWEISATVLLGDVQPANIMFLLPVGTSSFLGAITIRAAGCAEFEKTPGCVQLPSFNGLFMILKPAASLCVRWAVTPIGQKLHGQHVCTLYTGNKIR